MRWLGLECEALQQPVRELRDRA
ncbi:hypothetical protein EMIT0P201_30164 [Pseudomonas chlororaphis]